METPVRTPDTSRKDTSSKDTSSKDTSRKDTSSKDTSVLGPRGGAVAKCRKSSYYSSVFSYYRMCSLTVECVPSHTFWDLDSELSPSAVSPICV